MLVFAEVEPGLLVHEPANTPRVRPARCASRARYDSSLSPSHSCQHVAGAQEKKWCTGGSSHAVVEQQLAVHLAQTLFGFATFLNGGAVDKVVHTANLPQPDIAQLEKKYVADHPEAVHTERGGGGSGGFWRGALAALVTVAAVASLGALAWVATAQWRQEHLAEWTGKTAGYQPMMPTDEGQQL